MSARYKLDAIFNELKTLIGNEHDDHNEARNHSTSILIRINSLLYRYKLPEIRSFTSFTKAAPNIFLSLFIRMLVENHIGLYQDQDARRTVFRDIKKDPESQTDFIQNVKIIVEEMRKLLVDPLFILLEGDKRISTHQIFIDNSNNDNINGEMMFISEARQHALGLLLSISIERICERVVDDIFALLKLFEFWDLVILSQSQSESLLSNSSNQSHSQISSNGMASSEQTSDNSNNQSDSISGQDVLLDLTHAGNASSFLNSDESNNKLSDASQESSHNEQYSYESFNNFQDDVNRNQRYEFIEVINSDTSNSEPLSNHSQEQPNQLMHDDVDASHTELQTIFDAIEQSSDIHKQLDHENIVQRSTQDEKSWELHNHENHHQPTSNTNTKTSHNITKSTDSSSSSFVEYSVNNQSRERYEIVGAGDESELKSLLRMKSDLHQLDYSKVKKELLLKQRQEMLRNVIETEERWKKVNVTRISNEMNREMKIKEEKEKRLNQIKIRNIMHDEKVHKIKMKRLTEDLIREEKGRYLRIQDKERRFINDILQDMMKEQKESKQDIDTIEEQKHYKMMNDMMNTYDSTKKFYSDQLDIYEEWLRERKEKRKMDEQNVKHEMRKIKKELENDCADKIKKMKSELESQIDYLGETGYISSSLAVSNAFHLLQEHSIRTFAPPSPLSSASGLSRSRRKELISIL